MNWGRAKSILIILFLVVDMMLLATFITLSYRANTLRQDAINRTVQALSESSISIDKSLIRNEKYRDYHLDMANLSYQGDFAAMQFLGEGYQKINDTEYQLGDTGLHIKDGNITYRNHRTPIYFTQRADFDKTGELCETYLKDLGFDKDSYFMYNKRLENGIFSFEIMPRYKEYKIEGVRMKGTADKKGILSLSGNWFYVRFSEPSSKETFCNITSVLLSFMYTEAKSGKTISKIDGCYYIPAEQSTAETVAPVPVYILSCSDGSVAIFSAKDATLILKTK